ncbi:MAG TPA: hypothetical protein VL242_46240 [Sorangium sp.]|nr:hypothetical protein [Sorangium sp.]
MSDNTCKGAATGAHLRVRDDGNLVIHSSSGATVWTSGTTCR